MKLQTQKLMILAATAALALTASFAKAQSGNDGGGGGGICVNGKCMTLAEAGLKIAPPPEGTIPGVPTPAVGLDLLNEYKSINDQVYRSYPAAVATGFSEQELLKTFYRVDVYNPTALSQITKDYAAVMSANGFATKDFTIFAISDAKSTFLLPSFFRLNLRSQALILQHESLMRRYFTHRRQDMSTAQALKVILASDVAFDELLKGDRSGLLALARGYIEFGGPKFEMNYRILSARLQSMFLNGPAVAISAELSAGFTDKHLSPLAQQDSYQEVAFWQRMQKEMPALTRALIESQMESMGYLPATLQTTRGKDSLVRTAYSNYRVSCEGRSDGAYLFKGDDIAQLVYGKCKSGLLDEGVAIAVRFKK